MHECIQLCFISNYVTLFPVTSVVLCFEVDVYRTTALGDSCLSNFLAEL